MIAERVMPGLVFGRETGYAHPIHGTEAAIKALTRKDVVDQFQQAYGSVGATLIVAGDVTLSEVVTQAEAAFGDWKSGSNSGSTRVEAPAQRPVLTPEPPRIGNPSGTCIYLVDKPGAAQSVIRATHTTIPRLHADYAGLLLLNYSFGGQFSARLNLNLRQDKGYSYGYNSGIQWHRGPSLLFAGGSVQTAVTKESVEETLREFKDVHASRPISQEELEGAKAGILQGYPASFERPGQLIGHLVQLVLFNLPDDYFQTVRPNIEAASLEDIHRIGAEHISPGQLSILVVGDRQSVEPGLRELGLPLVLLDDDGNPVN